MRRRRKRGKSSRVQSPEAASASAAASLGPGNRGGSGGGPAMDSQDLEGEPGRPAKDASTKPTEDKAPEEETPLLEAALEEPKLNSTCPEGSGDAGGGGSPKPEAKAPSKRALAAESPETSPKKAKKSSGDSTVPQASSHAEEQPGAKAEQAEPESEPEALQKPPEPVEESSVKEEAPRKPESAPSGPSSSSSDSGSKPSQSHSQGALLFGKPRRIPTAAEFSFRIDRGKDGGQSSTKKLDSTEPGKPPTKLWLSEGDGRKGSLPKMSEKPDARCFPAATKISFHANQDKDFGKSKDGDQSSTKKFDSLESGEPPARLWPSEGDGKKESLPKMSKEPEAREIPTAVKFNFRVDWDKDFGKSNNGGQSSAKKSGSIDLGGPPAKLQNSEGGDGEKGNLLKMSKEPEARHIPTAAECSFQTGQDRDFSRSKDGSESNTKMLGSVESGEAPAELQNSGGDGDKESLPKMSMEPETRFADNLNNKPNAKKGEECMLGPRRGFPNDIENYMSIKPPDLGDSCVHFSKFGKCQYWVTCRFAGAHLGEGYQNMVNEELWKEWEGKSPVRNMLVTKGSGSMILKKFPFKKSIDYVLSLNKASRAMKNAAAKKTETSALKTIGVLTDEDLIRLRPCEKRKLDLQGKIYLSPLSKCGSLPFRRICKQFGADITCGEMLPCLLSPHHIPGAVVNLHRHETEDFFGIQLQERYPKYMAKYSELLNETCQVDFVEINAEHTNPVNYFKGGSFEDISLTSNPVWFEKIVRGMDYVLDVPVTVKLKTGSDNTGRLAHTMIPKLRDWGVSMVTLHGRSSEGLYQNLADWEYIGECAKLSAPMPLFGNGDIYSFEDATRAMEMGVSGITIARAALIKPWIFTEIKERRHWDISARERLDILKDFTDFGLEYWGSDNTGVERTRRFLLNWLQFLCRYVPVGLLERLPPKMTDQHPGILYGDYLENLMSSEMIKDWVKISEMFLGTVPDDYHFKPIHNVDAYLRRL